MDLDAADTLVAQYLQERGYHVAYMAMLDESQTTNKKVEFLEGGRLRTILDAYNDGVNAEESAATGTTGTTFDVLENPGDGDFIEDLVANVENIHSGNVLAARQLPNGNIISSATDRTVKITEVHDGDAAEVSTTFFTSPGPVLTIDWNQHNPDLVLVGDMGGNTSVLSIRQRKAIFMAPKHMKYIVRARFSRCGHYFATAAYDNECRIFKENPVANDNGGDMYRRIKVLNCSGHVECLAFSPDVDDSTSEMVMCARNDHRIHVLQLDTLKHRSINMNANGDDWVSFTALDISFNAAGTCILVSTDKDRLILFDRATGTQLRNFYGASNDAYSNPRHCWHPSGLYIYATSQNHEIVVWEVYTGKIVATLKEHTQPIKDLSLNPNTNTLVSCGFDKTIKIWKKVL